VEKIWGNGNGVFFLNVAEGPRFPFFCFLLLAYVLVRLSEPRASTPQPASTCASTWRQPMGVDPDVNLRRPASTCVNLSVDATMCGRRRLASTGVNQRRR
jgi:hypothetical protein